MIEPQGLVVRVKQGPVDKVKFCVIVSILLRTFG